MSSPRTLKQMMAFCVVIALGLSCLGLARWQYHRALEKEAQQASWQAQQGQSAHRWEAFIEKFPTRVPMGKWHQVDLSGQWLDDQSIFLENYPHGDDFGTLWLAPLRLQPGGTNVMVIVGWKPLPPLSSQPSTVMPVSANQPPRGLLSTTTETLAIQGWTDYPSLSRFALGEDAKNSRSWLSYSNEKYQQKLGIKVSPWLVWATTNTPALADAGWKIVNPVDSQQDLSAAKHWGYMGQWLVFALMAFLLAVLLLRKKTNEKLNYPCH